MAFRGHFLSNSSSSSSSRHVLNSVICRLPNGIGLGSVQKFPSPSSSISSSSSYYYISKRHGIVGEIFSSIAGQVFKTKRIVGRENFKPKGILVYKSNFFKYFSHGYWFSTIFAIAFTTNTLYNYFYPLEALPQNNFVAFIAVLSMWSVPLLLIPSFSRRYVTRIWVEGNICAHIESHNRLGGLRYYRLPLGAIEMPISQLSDNKGIRQHMVGMKIDTEWGLFYLRKNGRFIDKPALTMLFGQKAVEGLAQQRLIRPLAFPLEVMDNSLFPSTQCKDIIEREKEELERNPINIEDTWLERVRIFKRFQRWRVRRLRKKSGQDTTEEPIILIPSFKSINELKPEVISPTLKEQIITKLQNSRARMKNKYSFNPYFSFQIMTEEMADYKLYPPLKECQVFQKNLDLYQKFVDLSVFTIRELAMMKEYNQLAFLEDKSENLNKLRGEKGKKSLIFTEGWNKRKRSYESGFDHENNPCFKHAQQRLMHRLYENFHNIESNWDKPRDYINRDQIRSKNGPSVLLLKEKLDNGEADDNGHVTFENKYQTVDLYTNGSLLQTMQELENKKGYVTSKYAYDERHEKKIKELVEDMNSGNLGPIGWKMTGKGNRFANVNPKRRKIGRRFWHRHVGSSYRPRRLGMKRWGQYKLRRYVSDRVKPERKRKGI